MGVPESWEEGRAEMEEKAEIHRRFRIIKEVGLKACWEGLGTGGKEDDRG